MEFQEKLPGTRFEIPGAVQIVIAVAVRRADIKDRERIDAIGQQRLDVHPVAKLIILQHQAQKKFPAELVAEAGTHDVAFEERLIGVGMIQAGVDEPGLNDQLVDGFKGAPQFQIGALTQHSRFFITGNEAPLLRPESQADHLAEVGVHIHHEAADAVKLQTLVIFPAGQKGQVDVGLLFKLQIELRHDPLILAQPVEIPYPADIHAGGYLIDKFMVVFIEAPAGPEIDLAVVVAEDEAIVGAEFRRPVPIIDIEAPGARIPFHAEVGGAAPVSFPVEGGAVLAAIKSHRVKIFCQGGVIGFFGAAAHHLPFQVIFLVQAEHAIQTQGGTGTAHIAFKTAVGTHQPNV